MASDTGLPVNQAPIDGDRLSGLSFRTTMLALVAVGALPALALALYAALDREAIPLPLGAVLLAAAAYAVIFVTVWILAERWQRRLRQHSEGRATEPAEPRLRADLAERDQMLREIHHRVKNNLQMISSLLGLQAGKIRSPRIRRIFANAQNRVMVMAVLHRHLYERANWMQVDFQAYLNDLVRSLESDARELSRIRFSIRAPVLQVGPDVAIPVGLVVMEAVSNAVTHAFHGIANPEITIRGHESAGMFELSVEDNGVGIDERHSVLADGPGLGFTLVRGLAAQLEGRAELAPRDGGGTCLRLHFPSSFGKVPQRPLG